MIQNNRKMHVGLLVAAVVASAACQPTNRQAPEPVPPLISPPQIGSPTSAVASPSPSRRPAHGTPATEGGFCPTLGAIGYTAQGVKMVCDHSHSENYLRWRRAQ